MQNVGWTKPSGGGGAIPSNKETLDKLSDNGTQLLFNGSPVGGGGSATNIWAGKSFNFLGDSITDGSVGVTPFRQVLATEMQLANARNYGIGGTTVSDRSNPFYARVAGMNAAADVVFVLGGTNDFGLSVAIGELNTVDANGVRIPNADTTTFYGGYHKLAQNLIARYPDKRIILATPMHRNAFTGAVIQPPDTTPNDAGHYLSDYVDAVIAIGKWYSFPVCDLYNNFGVNPNETAQKDLYTLDGLHPNEAGTHRLAKVIEGFLNTILI